MKTYDNHLSRSHFMQGRSTMPEMFVPAEEHGVDRMDNVEEATSEQEMDFEDSQYSSSVDTTVEEELQRVAAQWILKIKETCKLTQSAMDNIIEGVTDFHNFMLSKIHIVLKKALNSLHIDMDDIPQLKQVFECDSPFTRPFTGVETSYQQLNYYKSQLGLVVSMSLVISQHIRTIFQLA